jgi:hypothetical protein
MDQTTQARSEYDEIYHCSSNCEYVLLTVSLKQRSAVCTVSTRLQQRQANSDDCRSQGEIMTCDHTSGPLDDVRLMGLVHMERCRAQSRDDIHSSSV